MNGIAPTCTGTAASRCVPGITIPAASASKDNCGYPLASFAENSVLCGINGIGGGLEPAQIYVTDITFDPTCRTGDWQSGGQAYDPVAVFGTWKSINSDTPDAGADPTMYNYWKLGEGSDPIPPSVSNQCPCVVGNCTGSDLNTTGFGAEVRFEAALTSGHSYRFQVMVHDGDQTATGGDSAEACIVYCAGGGPCSPLTCADYPRCTCGAQSDGCNGTIDCGLCCCPKTCEEACNEGCSSVYDPATYGVACPQSDACGDVLSCFCKLF